MHIQIFTAGGTIDKIYFDDRSTYEVGAPKIEEILSEANVNLPYTVELIFRKDSLHMTGQDRELIREKVLACPHERIVITHGTDTMAETARSLGMIPGKTIVLTGAMAPARFKTSDAAFNIGCAIAAVQTLPPGVYIAISGRIFDPWHVRKNREQNWFEET